MEREDLLKEDKETFSFPVIRVQQPMGEFFVGTLPHQLLLKICSFDIRRLLRTNHFEDFLGIQREIDKKRIKEIRQYVSTVSATFPTAVILSVREQSAQIELLPKPKSTGKYVGGELALLKLSNTPDAEVDETSEKVLSSQIATIIDGQHRIESLREFGDHKFDINVAIFVGLDKASEAEVFSTVNLAQTKVNKSLVYDLFSYSEQRSPEKTCHEVALVLNSEEESPFFERIKRLGVATDGVFGETLSQATFVKGLIKYMSRDPLGDRDIGKRSGKWSKVSPEEFEKFIMRPFFVSNEDEKIADVLWNYFDAIRERWPKAWAATGTGYILNKTTGYLALMRFFHDAYLHSTRKPIVVDKSVFSRLFVKSKIQDEDFNKEVFVPGSSGEGKLYRTLRHECLGGPPP
jgi:DGQHR domain-containing protein